LQVYASGGSSWIIDSGCTNHMMGEKKMFTSYVKNKDSQDSIIFGDGNQGKVKGLGKIAISSEHSISNVFLVESLGYNLLSVSQLCNMGYNCLFTNVDVSVFRRSDGSLAFKGVLDDKLYLVNFSKEEAGLDACLIAKTSMGWLWHRRLAHVGMKNLHKCSIPKIQILKFSQTPSKFKMNFKFHFKMFVCKLISTNKLQWSIFSPKSSSKYFTNISPVTPLKFFQKYRPDISRVIPFKFFPE
jgi:hypothetical protein